MADLRKVAKAVTSVITPPVNRLDMSYKDVTKRVPELTEAAQKLSRGEITAADYAALVNKAKPVTPYSFVPQPATTEDATKALDKNKRLMFGKTAEIAAGEPTALRLDIPAYQNHGVWVNSVHREGQPTVYGAVSSVKNATMSGAPEKAMRVATGEASKGPWAVIRGEWNPMDEAAAVKSAQQYLKSKEWRQVGYDPERHGYFYDRETMAPVLGAEEVIQIGPLVLAKKPKYGDPKDFPFKKGGRAMAGGGIAKLAKAVTSVIKQDVLPAEERAANLAKMLEGSKVKERLYHATPADIAEFKPGGNDPTLSGPAIWMTPNAENQPAAHNIKRVPGQPGRIYRGNQFTPGTNVMPLYANIKNPLISTEETWKSDFAKVGGGSPWVLSPEEVASIRAAGHDGVFYYDKNGKLTEVLAFQPEQVKSAIGNRGTYDVTKKDITKAKGGPVKMAGGGRFGLVEKIGKALTSTLREAAESPKAGAKLTAAEEASLRARGLGVPGKDFADVLNPKDVMRMSEALGAAGAEGKTLNLTQADRSRVFGPNKGGTGFSGLQLTSEPHQQAGSVWGVGKPSHVTRLINANTPETVWSTFIGAPTQHMSNPVTVERMYEAHKKAHPSAALIERMNAQINSAIDPKTGKKIFPEPIDISDPSSLSKAQTFNQRKVLAQAMTIGGEKKGEKAAQEAFRIIKEETDPLLVDAPTYAVGNRLFTIDKDVGIYRPDLNAAFPHQVTGTDLGLLFRPTPIQLAAPEFVSKYATRVNKSGKPQPMGHKDLTATTPKQFISEKYLTDLQKAGYKGGGEVEGGSFSERFKSLLDKHLAEGGPADTRPDVTDSGTMIQGEAFANGGPIKFKTLRNRKPKRFDKGGMAFSDPLGAPDAPVDPLDRKAWGAVFGDVRKALEKEFALIKDPKTRADVLKRIGLTAAGGGPDLANLLASGVDLVQEQIPALREPVSVMGPGAGYKPKFPLSRKEIPGGSEHLLRLAKESKLIGDTEAPILETATSLVAPFAATPALKAVKAAPRAAKGLVNAMVEPVNPRLAQRGAITWHGSPHRFPPTEKNPLGEFDPTKIGSGEGAQAYGYGHYVAEAPEVAKEYARTLANRDLKNQGRLNAHANAQRLVGMAGDPKYAADDIKFALEVNPDHPQKKLLQETLGFLESGKYKEPLQTTGNVYKIDIPDEQIAKMLDWDKPLSEQPKTLQEIAKAKDPNLASKEPHFVTPTGDVIHWSDLLNSAEELKNPKLRAIAPKVLGGQWVEYGDYMMKKTTGEDFYRNLSAPSEWQETSSVLRELGIPGIRYLDQASRGPSGTGRWRVKFKDGTEQIFNYKLNDDVLESIGATAEPVGTSNFVVFPGNEGMMKIIERQKRGGLAQVKGR